MPKLLFARAPLDSKEEHQMRKLAGSRHAPGDWITRAKMIVGSWERKRMTASDEELNCHPQTVRERIVRLDAEVVDALGDHAGAGRKPPLTEQERGSIVALARSLPVGKAVRMWDELATVESDNEAHWTWMPCYCAGSRGAVAGHPGPAESDPAYCGMKGYGGGVPGPRPRALTRTL